ncbi:EpsG family protein [Erwinia sp. INIA-01]|uniref:EpsG family protein n=1 Tax=Erwinia sp. INIA01 TaxID=2991500 RepID=UPI002224D4EC|nr:EpsG family protein [Erwinia sp. INIA01]MCW1874110.1 EpsG family protein [Erwinia sp. INIA01]
MNTFCHMGLSREYVIFLLVSIACSITLFVSPLLGLYLTILYFLFVKVDSVILRLPGEIFAIICMSVIAASIQVGYGHGDDYYNVYIPVYESIGKGGSIFSFFSGGVEFGLPLFFYIINKFFPDANYIQLSGIITFIYSFIFILWVERFFLKNIEDKYKGIALAALLLFFNYLILVHLMRQSLASLFVLFSIGYFQEHKNRKGIIFFIIACVCHLSSAIIIPLFIVFLSSRKYLKVAFVSFIVFSVISFKFLIGFIVAHNIFGVATYKMAVYENDVIETTAGAGFVLHFIVLFVLSRFIRDNSTESYKSLIFYSCPAYLALTLIPFASDRLFMPITGFMLGGLFFICFKRYVTIFRLLLLAYCILRFVRLGPYANNIYGLWFNYPWLGSFFI